MSRTPAYSPLLSVWAFRHRCPTMPAVDSCTAINNPCEPQDTAQASRSKPNRLRHAPARSTTPDLDGYGLRDHRLIGSLVRPGKPHIWFLFVRSWLCYTLFRLRLTTTPLRFANPSPPSGWTEDSHPPKLSRMLGAPKKAPLSGAFFAGWKRKLIPRQRPCRRRPRESLHPHARLPRSRRPTDPTAGTRPHCPLARWSHCA